jgi:transcriptional regulator with PAS, ATPase and Fis domain
MHTGSSRPSPKILTDDCLTILECKSPVLRAALKNLPAIAGSSRTVLITGETGTGKELCARAIHQLSKRASQQFVPVNCANLTPELAGNELFGHVAGAYTGAERRGDGYISAADGGTLFLDEINSLLKHVQGKLLRFFDHGEANPVGAAKAAHVDVRTVVATNADLEQLVCQGNFRADLYYRITQLTIEVPPVKSAMG